MEAFGTVWDLLKKDEWTAHDLDSLRRNIMGFSEIHGGGAVLAQGRLTVELIDRLLRLDESIKSLNESSSNLVGTTNRLTEWILVLTVVGIALAGVGAAEVLRRWFMPS